MSPLWRDRVVIGLAPGRLSALRLGRGWRPRLLSARTLDLEATTGPLRQAPVAAMKQLFDDAAWRDADLHIVLSNHFMHYALVAGDASLTNESERQRLAGIVVGKTYGDLARHWDLRLSPASRGEPSVVSGIDQGLLVALRDACPADMALRSIRPLLMGVFNHALANHKMQSGYLAVVEPGRVLMAHVEGGRWQSVTGRTVCADDTRALIQLLERDCALCGRPAAGNLWVWDPAGICTLPTGAPWMMHKLSSPLAGTEVAYWGLI